MADIVQVTIGNVLRVPLSTASVAVGGEAPAISIVESGDNQVISVAAVPSYLSGSIAVIGDSQGTGNYQTAGKGLVDLLEVAFPDATFTNYCVVNYNGRKIMPDGDNIYVDPAKNITRALADGNKVIIVCDTSNDSDSTNPAGGLVPLAEWQSNLLDIQEAAINAGARILFISTFPRQQLSAGGQQQQKDMAAYELRTFPGNVIYVYNVLANPSNDLQLRPEYNYGDNIHLNDAGAAALANVVISQLNQVFVAEPAKRSQILIQSATSANGPWSSQATITDNTLNSITITKDEKLYRARLAYSGGYVSPWSTIVQGLSSGGVDPEPELQDAGFRMSLSNSDTVSGFVNVTGGGRAPENYSRVWTHPSGITLTHLVTDATTATEKWGGEFVPGNAGNDSGETVNDGGGMLPVSGAQVGAWFNNGVASPGNQFVIGGGVPGGVYTVDMYGSLNDSFGLDADPMQVGFTGKTAIQFNASGATSQRGRFTDIIADQDGTIGSCYSAPVAGQSQFGMCNAIVVTQTA